MKMNSLGAYAKKGVTGRYATAPDSALIFAANRISQHLADALDGRASAKVIQLGR